MRAGAPRDVLKEAELARWVWTLRTLGYMDVYVWTCYTHSRGRRDGAADGSERTNVHVNMYM